MNYIIYFIVLIVNVIALHYAAEEGLCDLIEVFLKYKANPLIEDHEGNKPHQLAKKNNKVEAKRLIRKLLINHFLIFINNIS